jgi:hypothetical protein
MCSRRIADAARCPPSDGWHAACCMRQEATPRLDYPLALRLGLSLCTISMFSQRCTACDSFYVLPRTGGADVLPSYRRDALRDQLIRCKVGPAQHLDRLSICECLCAVVLTAQTPASTPAGCLGGSSSSPHTTSVRSASLSGYVVPTLATDCRYAREPKATYPTSRQDEGRFLRFCVPELRESGRSQIPSEGDVTVACKTLWQATRLHNCHKGVGKFS